MTVIQDLFISNCETAVRRAKRLEKVQHKGLRGTYREIVMSEILSGVLPPDVKIGTGELVDHRGVPSKQVDVLLYAPAVAPALLFDERQGTFPAESVLYTIEVKSKLTRAKLREAIENARSILTRDYLPALHYDAGAISAGLERAEQTSPVEMNAIVPTICLFAFGSDLVGSPASEIERYSELDDVYDVDVRPSITQICVVGRGYWSYSGSKEWLYHPASEETFSEITAFVGGILNIIPKMLVVKGRVEYSKYIAPAPSAQIMRPR